MTVAIAFFPGSYGTYLEWCLTTLTSSQPVTPPFSHNGSSHNFVGNRVVAFKGWKKFVESNHTADFVSFHPKSDPQESLSDNMTWVCETAHKTIYLYPDKDSVLLCINNWYHKVYQDWWTNIVNRHPDLYKNWPIDPGTDPAKIPQWIRREFLSFYMMPMWADTVEWCHTDVWNHSNCCVITMADLLYRFDQTLQHIGNFCQLTYVKPISDLAPTHAANLAQQQYLHADRLCAQIIDSVGQSQNFSWNPLSLVSESWIQWRLRDLGYEIKCHELDKFPTDSVHLKELLYTI